MLTKSLSLVAMLVTLTLGAGCAVDPVVPSPEPVPVDPTPSPVIYRSTMTMTVSDLGKLDAIARLMHAETTYEITFKGSSSWTAAEWEMVVAWLEPKANVRASFAS